MTTSFGKLQNSWWTRYAVVLPLTLLLLPARPILGQVSPEQRLTQAYVMEREGHPASAISVLQALLESKSLDTLGTGKAWNILALSYEDQGEFSLSQHAYEESLRILEGLPNNTQDYAMALDGFGGLYVVTGQLDTADKMRLKALDLYEKIGDHAGMARVTSDLAAVAFTRKKVSEGKKFLEQAQKEASLTHDLNNDDQAAIASMQGWLAQLKSNYAECVSRYKQSLDLWKKGHGEEHPFTGWGYMLLGEAHAEEGDLAAALNEMKKGVDILERAMSKQNPRYLTAEIAYSRILDEAGAHLQASQIRATAEQSLKESYTRQCVGCTVSAAAFR